MQAFPGLGQTTAVPALARDFHRREIPEGGAFTASGHERLAVCRVGLTGNTGMKDFNRAMLELLGHPGRTTGTTAQFAQRALDRVLSCEGRLLPEELGRRVAGPALQYQVGHRRRRVPVDYASCRYQVCRIATLAASARSSTPETSSLSLLIAAAELLGVDFTCYLHGDRSPVYALSRTWCG
ncbi:hypothetical protein [Streptomyces sp. NPDC003996]